jgi:hypothetical protein
MSLYVDIVQIVQRQGLAVIFHVVRFSLQEPMVCGLVAGLRVSVSVLSRIKCTSRNWSVINNDARIKHGQILRNVEGL